jgi:hypothetical protein
VDFVGTNIIITQNVWVRYYAKAISTSNDDVLVDDLQTDTYPITVIKGELIIGEATVKFEQRANHSGRDGFINAFSGINRVTESIQSQLQQLSNWKPSRFLPCRDLCSQEATRLCSRTPHFLSTRTFLRSSSTHLELVTQDWHFVTISQWYGSLGYVDSQAGL